MWVSPHALFGGKYLVFPKEFIAMTTPQFGRTDDEWCKLCPRLAMRQPWLMSQPMSLTSTIPLRDSLPCQRQHMWRNSESFVLINELKIKLRKKQLRKRMRLESLWRRLPLGPLCDREHYLTVCLKSLGLRVSLGGMYVSLRSLTYQMMKLPLSR